jgi:hypothetical protein
VLRGSDPAAFYKATFSLASGFSSARSARSAQATEAMAASSHPKPVNYYVSRLRVWVMGGSDLPAADSNGLSDPFVEVAKVPGFDLDKTWRTPVIPKTVNPTWTADNLLELSATLAFYDADDKKKKKGEFTALELEVYDKDKIGRNKLGTVSITLDEMIKSGGAVHDEWRPLANIPKGVKQRGTAKLHVRWQVTPSYMDVDDSVKKTPGGGRELPPNQPVPLDVQDVRFAVALGLPKFEGSYTYDFYVYAFNAKGEDIDYYNSSSLAQPPLSGSVMVHYETPGPEGEHMFAWIRTDWLPSDNHHIVFTIDEPTFIAEFNFTQTKSPQVRLFKADGTTVGVSKLGPLKKASSMIVAALSKAPSGAWVFTPANVPSPDESMEAAFCAKWLKSTGLLKS